MHQKRTRSEGGKIGTKTKKSPPNSASRIRLKRRVVSSHHRSVDRIRARSAEASDPSSHHRTTRTRSNSLPILPSKRTLSLSLSLSLTLPVRLKLAATTASHLPQNLNLSLLSPHGNLPCRHHRRRRSGKTHFDFTSNSAGSSRRTRAEEGGGEAGGGKERCI